MAFSGIIEAISWRQPNAATPAIIGFTAILIVFHLFNVFKKKHTSRLPPGPFAWPFIGNLHLFGKLPHRSLRDLANKYGPVMYLRFGYFPTVVVSSGVMAKEFLATQDLAFASRPKTAGGKHLCYNYKDLALSPYGPYWRHVRKICVTQLLSVKRLESFRCIREEEVSGVVRGIWEKSEQGTVAVNVSNAIQSLTSAIMWRILAGTKYSGDDAVGDIKSEELRDMVEEVFATSMAPNIGDYIPYLDWLDLQGINRRMKKAHLFFDRVVQKIIDDHVNVKRKQASNVKDFIDVLLELSQNDTVNIKAIIFDMFIAGIETTATSLDWTMSEMVRNPHIAKKLQEEIESVVGKHRAVTEADLGKMEYRQCVVKESLRLYPAAPLMFPHESTQVCDVGGFVLPQKTRLMVNVWAIGRDPAVWDDPTTFKPERFVGKDIDIQGRDFNVLPFGTGRRGCPGAQMAVGIMELMLAQLMHCFEWRVEGDPSHLDMTEVFRSSLNRKEHLFAIPTLKIPNVSLNHSFS
uniref:CYP750C23 n=1 Tax=Taxus chinensis TaxID=29808 RepID=A0A291FB40_TAXCH|nr:CYP750C23 [Taxus chinensis]